MKVKNSSADYGFDIAMTLPRAIRVWWWRKIQGKTWRAISFDWQEAYPDKSSLALGTNQYYGISVVDCAATTLGLNSYLSRWID